MRWLDHDVGSRHALVPIVRAVRFDRVRVVALIAVQYFRNRAAPAGGAAVGRVRQVAEFDCSVRVASGIQSDAIQDAPGVAIKLLAPPK